VNNVTHNLEPTGGSIFAQMVVLPVGAVSSGLLTWLLFGNLYGAAGFVALFVIGVAAESVRQRRAKARGAEADAAMGDYLSRLHNAARDSGLDLNSPPRDEI
jgi:hypothetical protein